MDYDDHAFEEANNRTDDGVDISAVPSEELAGEIVLIIFAIIGIIANILLIYIICYYRKLHTSTNIYLINWAIADSGSALITLSFFGVFESILDVSHYTLCFYAGLGFSLLFNEMIFMFLLTVDWCLSSYLPRPLEKFRERTAIIVAIVWLASVVFFAASSGLCFSVSSVYLEFHISLPLIYAALLIFVVSLYVFRIVQKIRKNQEYVAVSVLALPTAFVLCGLLSWLNLLFFGIRVYLIPEIPVFLHPSINLLLVIFIDPDFKTCFLQVIRCPSCALSKWRFRNNEDGGLDNPGQNQATAFDKKMFDINRHV